MSSDNKRVANLHGCLSYRDIGAPFELTEAGDPRHLTEKLRFVIQSLPPAPSFHGWRQLHTAVT